MNHKRHKHSGQSSEQHTDAEKLVKHMPPGNIVLDAGSGPGYVTKVLAKRYPKVIAVDTHAPSIENIKRTLPNAKAILADLTKNIPLDKSSVDVILTCTTLHGFVANGELDDVISEFKRTLKPNGYLVIADHAKPRTKHMNCVSEKDATKLMLKYGFELEKEFSAGSDVYGLTFRQVL